MCYKLHFKSNLTKVTPNTHGNQDAIAHATGNWAFHIVSSEIAPLLLLLVTNNNMCHHQTTINSLSWSNWVEYFAFAMRNNQPTSLFVS
jgi:hypothetical protein